MNHQWTHVGRLWTNGEPFLAVDATLRDAWLGFSQDQYSQVVGLGQQDASITVGTGRAAVVGADAVVRDDSWMEVLQNPKGGYPGYPDRRPSVNDRCDSQRTGSASAVRPRDLDGQLLAAAHAGGRRNDGGVRHYVGMVSSASWLDRYHAGQRDQVWHELRQLGAAVREPGLPEQAQLVCDEMARRARRNIEVIIERLSGAGYRFHSNDDTQEPVTPHVPPAAGAAAHADWLQQRFGPVPMTLLSWVRLTGDVWLVGTHPQWAESASADPLVIEAEGSRYPGEPIRGYFERARAVARMGRAGASGGRAVRAPAHAGPAA